MEYDVWKILVASFVALIVFLVTMTALGGFLYLWARGRNLNPQPATNPGTVGPAPAAPPPPRNWNLSYWLMLVGKIAMTLVVVALFATLCWYAYTYFSGVGVTLPSVPTVTLPSWNMPDVDLIAIVLAFVALAAVGGGMYYFDDRKRLATYILVTLVVLTVYYMYRYGMLNTARTIPLYVLAAIAAVMVWTYVKGFAWVSLELLIVVAFIMLGYSHHHNWDQFTDMVASYIPGGGSGSNSQVTYATTSGCNGKPTVYTYNAGSLYDVNQNTCQVRAYVMQGCVEWYDASRLRIGQTCTGGSLPFGIRYMKPQSQAVVRLNHCRNYSPGILVDACA